MPAVNVSIGVTQADSMYVPSSQTADPNAVPLQIGSGPQTITFNLMVASGAPAGTQLLFTQNADGWGNRAPIVFKTVTASDVSFPQGWNTAQQTAFLTRLQTALNGLVASASSNSTVSLNINPATLEAGNAFQIDLPYTVNYFINVNGVSFGPNAFDPEVDILPGSK